VQFRSQVHAARRSQLEKPLAFISYDSRDRNVAQKIAIGLQRLMCPVWYDEFSLRVGDNLRDSIEKGLKECKKCILILSPNFLSNRGWTKREFDSVFTREVLEERHVVLPVWHGVGMQDVYDYSPSLLNVKALDWAQLDEEEACRRLCQAIEPPR
jgi:TIR domain